MTTEQYQIGYEAGHSDGFDEAVKQAAQPDCRTCFYGDTPDEFNEYQWKCLSLSKVCINGNQYKPVERVVLWRTE